MATAARVTPTGWAQYDDASTFSRVTPAGWIQVVSAGGVTGTLARTNANDTSAASGTTTVTGTVAYTNANDTSAASGSVGGGSTGTVAYTNANDTSAASGTTTVTGTVARTNANDSAAASGWAGTITGTVAYTNANDTVVASGSGGGAAEATARKSALAGGYTSGFVKARKRLALQRVLDYLTSPEPEEETKRIIRQIKAGKPLSEVEDKKPPVVMAEVSAEKLADMLIPSRVVAMQEIEPDLHAVVRKAIRLAQERDDEDVLLLL